MNVTDKIELYNCDNMELMSKYPDNYFDLAIVDPPYRDENQPTKDMRINGSMKSLEGRPSKEYFNELLRVSKNQIIWGANNFQLPQFKGFIVWKKLTISEDFTMSMAEIASISDGLGTTSFITKSNYLAIFIVSCLISLLWAFNVSKISVSTINQKLTYALGAGCGAVVGLWLVKLFR